MNRNRYRREKERREAKIMFMRILLWSGLTMLIGSWLSLCAPSMITEKEYQDRHLRESLNGEAKYRATRMLNEAVNP